jgi:hypothetical protein
LLAQVAAEVKTPAQAIEALRIVLHVMERFPEEDRNNELAFPLINSAVRVLLGCAQMTAAGCA